MASRFLLDKPKSKPVEFIYRGLTFWLKPEPNLAEWNRIRAEQMTAAGLDPGEIGEFDDADSGKWYGRAMASAFVDGIDEFEIEQEDGSVVIFKFDDPSDMDMYETAGEELLGENANLQNDVFAEVLRLVKHRPDYEVRALGKLSKPADSGV